MALGGRREGSGRKHRLTADEDTLKKIKGLGAIQATLPEAGAVLGCCKNTFVAFLRDNPEAEEIFDLGKLEGRASLRRKQFKMADTSAAMAIFLGKNYLGQADKQEIEQTVTNFDLSKATEEELDQMFRIHERIAQRRAGEE